MSPAARVANSAALLLLLAACCCWASSPPSSPYGRRYSGFSVHRLTPQTGEQLEQLRSLQDQQRWRGVQFWREPSLVNRSVDVMVPPHKLDAFRDRLGQWTLPSEVIIRDVAGAIAGTSLPPTNNRQFTNYSNIRDSMDARQFYSSYHSYAEIEARLLSLAREDARVSVYEMGQSFEGRRLLLVKVRKNAAVERPVIFVDAGHHAREWISVATGLYVLESLVNSKVPLHRQVEPAPRELSGFLDEFEFWFVPSVNPDGYEYTRRSDRLWRKTRSRSGLCIGVDPNRNYPFHWREAGASAFSCDDTYAGPYALSEPETRALAKTLEDNGPRIVMYLSLHSYSQLLLTPYGVRSLVPDNLGELNRVGGAWVERVRKMRGTKYGVGQSAAVLYPAAGGSDDFAHGVAKIKLAYTIELPDEGRYGFLLPPREIIPVGQEAVMGIEAMLQAHSGAQSSGLPLKRDTE